jgi:hypothetical protein
MKSGLLPFVRTMDKSMAAAEVLIHPQESMCVLSVLDMGEVVGINRKGVGGVVGLGSQDNAELAILLAVLPLLCEKTLLGFAFVARLGFVDGYCTQ